MPDELPDIEYTIVLPIQPNFDSIDIFWLAETGIFTKDELKQSIQQNLPPGSSCFKNNHIMIIKDFNRLMFSFLTKEKQNTIFIKETISHFCSLYDFLAIGINFAIQTDGNGAVFYNLNNPLYHFFDKDKDLFGISCSADRGDYIETFKASAVNMVKQEEEVSKKLIVSVNNHFPKKENWNFIQIIDQIDTLLAQFKDRIDTIIRVKNELR